MQWPRQRPRSDMACDLHQCGARRPTRRRYSKLPPLRQRSRCTHTYAGGPRGPTEAIVRRGVTTVGRLASAGRTGACRCATIQPVAAMTAARGWGDVVQRSTWQQQGPPSSAGHPEGAVAEAAPDGACFVARATEVAPDGARFVATVKWAPCRDACFTPSCEPPWALATGAHSAHAAANAISSEISGDTALLYHSGPTARTKPRPRPVGVSRAPSRGGAARRMHARSAAPRATVCGLQRNAGALTAVARRGISR